MKFCFLDSEYKRLRAVLLYRPGSRIGDIKNPRSVLHLGKINYRLLMKEFDGLVSVYKELNVSVSFIKNDCKIPAARAGYQYNMMYARDLFFMTPKGAVVSAMFHGVRREEPLFAARSIENSGVPVLATIKGGATFEGADALWVTPRMVMVGVGQRTSKEGFTQLKAILKQQGIRCVPVVAPKGTQHLLGVVQFVDTRLALVRQKWVNKETRSFLRKNQIEVIPVPENNEIRCRQAMNIVVIAPRKIVMPTDCPKTRVFFRHCGLEVAVEVPVTELRKGAGGLACATGIMQRDCLC